MKQAENRILSNLTDSEFFASVIDFATDAIYTKNLKGVILSWNKSAEKLYGYQAKDVIGKNVNILIPTEKHTEEKNLIDNILWDGVSDNYETIRLHKNGYLLYVSITLSPIKSKDGKIIAVSNVSRDVSSKRRAEGKSQAILESAPDAMVIVNQFGQMVLVNAQTEKLFGYTRLELIGEDVELLIPGRYKGAHPKYRKNYFKDPRVRAMGHGLELYGLRSDGSEFPVEISLSPIEIEEGRFVSAAIRDISDKKAAQEALKAYAQKLENSNQELEQFAYVASHDLQEPLRKIVSFGERLKHKYSENLEPQAIDYIDRMHGAAGRMSNLIDDLLSFSRITSIKEPYRQTDLNKVLQDVVNDLEIAIEKKNARVIVHPLPELEAIPMQMRLLFQNLISNGIKFNDASSPKVEISAKTENVNGTNDMVKLSVRDNGIGVDDEYKEKIFKIFYRLHEVAKYTGTGIGLASCRKIVESHGGNIHVQNNPDGGSEFIINLPLKQESE